MTLGLAERQGDLLDDVLRFCDRSVPAGSVYAMLHRERDGLFPDELFADLFSERGRRSVPPSVVATVMVLQRLEGLSDREAVDRYAFDVRWRYAAGSGGYGGDARDRFAHTVLVDMRARLAASKDPRRIFRVCLDVASAAGLVGERRVLDSTPLYDAVATMDTVTLIRCAVRGLLRAAGDDLAAELRAALSSGDEYADAGKPRIDWDDAAARERLVDCLARDGHACLLVLDGREGLGGEVEQAGELLARVLGQDLEVRGDGVFAIARRVAKDRIISTVDTQARHGRKTSARGFDGYKGHVAIDPDSEIITGTTVSAGNVGDAAVAEELIEDLLGEAGPAAADAEVGAVDADGADTAAPPAGRDDAVGTDGTGPVDTEADGDGPRVYGDAAYGAGPFLDRLAGAGIASGCKTQPPTAPGGRFSKDAFNIDLAAGTVTCPAGRVAVIRRGRDGDGRADFGWACADCPLRSACTTARAGRSVAVGRHEQRLADARAQSRDPDWVADYRATRPKVERKLGHLMRRKHGGRRARMRGRVKVDADFSLLAAAHNLARLAVLGIRSTPNGWATATA